MAARERQCDLSHDIEGQKFGQLGRGPVLIFKKDATGRHTKTKTVRALVVGGAK